MNGRGAMAAAGRSRWRAWLPAISWAALIFVLSSIPGTSFPEVKTPHFDKLVHVVLYVVLGALCARALGLTSTLGARATVAVATLIAGFYGVSDEIHQIFTPYRTPDWHDAAADLAGGLVGAFVAVWLVRRSTARRHGSR